MVWHMRDDTRMSVKSNLPSGLRPIRRPQPCLLLLAAGRSRRLGRPKGTVVARGVPLLNLSAVVHSHCGDSYAACDLCDNETQYMGIECGYHYSPKGVSILAAAVADAFTGLLAALGGK